MANRHRLRRICYTINHPGPGDIALLKKINWIRYGVVGEEVGAGGTPHLQGCASLTRAIDFTIIKRTPPFDRAHIESMKGSILQASEYCKKDGKVHEWGEIPKQGKSKPLLDVVGRLRTGEKFDQLCDEDESAMVLVKHHRGLKFLQATLSRAIPLRKKTIVWLYGSTGVGKTYSARQVALDTGLRYWISNEDLRWFDGYTDQRIVIFDDLRHKHCTFQYLLRLLDQYELDVQIKGDYVRWNPEVIFITAPYSPRQMWNLRVEEDIRQLERRVHHCVDMSNDKHPLLFAGLVEMLSPTLLPVEDTIEEINLASSNGSNSHATSEEDSSATLMVDDDLPATISWDSEADYFDTDGHPTFLL